MMTGKPYSNAHECVRTAYGKTAAVAALILAVSAGGAFAQSYEITFSKLCDKLDITTAANGVVFGTSNEPGCDYGRLVGWQAALKPNVGPGGAVLIVSGGLGSPTGAFSWALNMRTKEATLVGLANLPFIQPLNTTFTYRVVAPPPTAVGGAEAPQAGGEAVPVDRKISAVEAAMGVIPIGHLPHCPPPYQPQNRSINLVYACPL